VNTIEEQLTQELQRQADSLPATSGDLQRVHRAGRRRLLASRVASTMTVTIVAFLAVTGAIALRGGSSSVVGDGGRVVFEDGYALTPAETTTLLVECLQDRGLDVTESSGGIIYDNRNVARSDFEAGVSACETELRGAGFLLPGDNPDNLTVLYLQFEALAECYRNAGIPTSDPPTVDEFIDARQAGIPTWSPQSEAIQHSGVDATTRAEQNCDIPTPEQFRVHD